MLLSPFRGLGFLGFKQVLPIESADCCMLGMVKVTSLLTKPESALGLSFGVRARQKR